MASGVPVAAISMPSPHPTPNDPLLQDVDVPRTILDPTDNDTSGKELKAIDTIKSISTVSILSTDSSNSTNSMSIASEISNGSVSDSYAPPIKPKSKSVSFIRNSKRSSSTSNDSLYERDRFRARLHNFNDSTELKEESEGLCDVCIIGSKTTKLNLSKDETGEFEESPLIEGSSFYNQLKDFDLCKLFRIKEIELKNIESIFEWYFNQTLPLTEEMFPWLHGLNPENVAQLQFFLQQPDNLFLNFKGLKQRPNCRFLMTINTDFGDSKDTHYFKNNTEIDEILCPIDTSRAEVQETVSQIVNSVFDKHPDKDELLDTILRDAFSMNVIPIFLNLDPSRGVSLRNFHIQVAKAGVCSDIIIYCFKESNLKFCHAVARLIWLAQRYEAKLHPDSKLTYNTFVLTHFDQVENNIKLYGNNTIAKTVFRNEDVDKMVKLKLEYLQNWDNEYVLKEKIETMKMSTASKLSGCLYSGNSWDYQNFLNFKYSTKKRYLSTKRSIDINTLYCNPCNSITTSNFNLDDLIETILPLPNMNYRFFISCFKEAAFPDNASLDNLLKLFDSYDQSNPHHQVGDYYCLNFPSSGSIGFGDIKADNIISIVNTCKLLYLISSKKSLDSLICCSDGYTELSLLILFYIMYSENCTLGDAVIKLHLKFGRPFYIFNTDVQILQKIEPILRRFSPVSKKTFNWSEFENISSTEINRILLAPIPTGGYKMLVEDSFKYDNDFSTSSSSDSSFDESFAEFRPNWCKEVEGSLPSRVLPYLYLGSLKHANCLPLLKELGIKKIISVGEPLQWLNHHSFRRQNNIEIEEFNNGDIEVYNISLNNSMVSDVTVDQIMKVNNLQDDGISQLESSLPTILQFIDNEYHKSKGQTKILIHCRVGVSRSATVVIAEVMKRLKINLPKAYMYVRVRRLNIIIQPNLKFMYELFRWEELHKSDKNEYIREIDWFAMCREITKLNQPYLTKN